MASQTSALPDGSTLTKPAYTDSADIAVINTNMDKIVSNINAENQALSNKTYPVSSGTIVSANDDFNSFVTPGVYTVSSNAIAQSVGNCPVANAGRLCVWSPTSNALNGAWAVGEQMYYAPATNGVYKRRSVADGSGNITWGAWQEFALKSNVAEKLNNFSGTHTIELLNNTGSISLVFKNTNVTGMSTRLNIFDTGKVTISRYANGAWQTEVTLRNADS